MQTHYILSITSNDKPGVVETLSSTIESLGGNWLESKLAHLSGKFVGVIKVSIEQSHCSELIHNLGELAHNGIVVLCEEDSTTDVENNTNKANFSVVGPDRTGIIKEISSAFTQQGINVEELETRISSMPYSGEPIFEANGQISVPQTINMKDLYDKLDLIANELGIDLEIDSEE